MPIEFRCDQCGQLLRTPDDSAGKSAKCPACGAVRQVPTHDATIINAEEVEGTSEGGAPGQAPGYGPGYGGDYGPGPAPGGYGGYPPPPPGYGPAPYPGDQTPPEVRVRAPGMALMIWGGVGCLFSLVTLINLWSTQEIVGIEQFQEMATAMGTELDTKLLFSSQMFFSVLSVAINGLIFFGGMRMRLLRNYYLAMTAAILALIPCWVPCCFGLIGMAIGIWALVVLTNSEVKNAFR